MADKTYQLTLNMSDGTVVDAGTITVPGERSYEYKFTKDDFKKVSESSQRRYIAIKKEVHGLTKPYVDKVLVQYKQDNEETSAFQAPIVVGEKTLSTDTIKIYINLDITNYTEYSGTIFLKGE